MSVLGGFLFASFLGGLHALARQDLDDLTGLGQTQAGRFSTGLQEQRLSFLAVVRFASLQQAQGELGSCDEERSDVAELLVDR